MLESCQNAQERWGGLHLMIDRWLRERHELVLLFEGLNSDQHAPAANADDLKGFCELLVDYVSAGHFEIYQQLLQELQTGLVNVTLPPGEDASGAASIDQGGPA